MAKETQGLQIALIIFVILGIGLGVSTFMLYKKTEELTMKSKEDSNARIIADGNCRAVQADKTELLRIIGAAASDKLEAVTAESNKDFETYAGSIEATSRNYRKVLAYLNDELGKKNVALAEEQKKSQDLANKIAVFEQVKEPQITEAQAGQKAAIDDRDKEREKFNSDRESWKGQTTTIQVTLEKSHKDADAADKKAKDALTKAEAALTAANKQAVEKNKQVIDLTKKTFESPLGKIRWVNQRERTVWIDLGRADALPRQLTLAVYSGNTQNVTSAAKKGGIEVSQILGDHLAEARIVDDNISDPLLPGDVVHTPLWTPGVREKFAFTDGMDIDANGTNRPDALRNLITMSGGEVVAELSDKGERKGQMDATTRFLIVGKEHTPGTPEALIKARVQMLREAEKLGVQTINLTDFLRRIDYKNPTPATHFGPGADPNQFLAKPPEGGPKSSGNSVSPIFKPRNPPPSSGSLY
jgi:ElaB/YqjD/DUF883 family membrane-anchored ribosome-binding protein